MKKYLGLEEMNLTMDDMRQVIFACESYSYSFSFYDECGFSSSTVVSCLSRKQIQYVLSEVQGLLICTDKEEVSPCYKKIYLCFDVDFESYVMAVVEEASNLI